MKKLLKIPKFKNEDEEREFWSRTLTGATERKSQWAQCAVPGFDEAVYRKGRGGGLR
jgi:hypothetical protein